MQHLPIGTVTLLFTDIEGSTQLLEHLGKRYTDVLAECRSLLRTAFHACGGHEVDTQGDAFFVAFARATDAVCAAVEMQHAMARHAWPVGGHGVYAWGCIRASRSFPLKGTLVWICIRLRAS